MPSDPVDRSEAPSPLAEGAARPPQGTGQIDSPAFARDRVEPSDTSADATPVSPPMPGDSSPSPDDAYSWSDLDESAPDQVQPSSPGEGGGGTAAAQLNNPDWIETEIPYHPQPLGVIDQIFLLLTDMLGLWRRALRWLRSQLPPGWQRNLSDQLLTAMVLGLVVLVVVVGSPAGGRSRPTPLPSARQESASPASQAISPAPTPVATPIADIEAQVSRIAQAYGAELVTSVEVTQAPQGLVITLAADWYGLQTRQQQQLAGAIYEQAQPLGFAQLTLRTADGLVVARSPVVGDTMVILHSVGPEPSLLPA
ncbi:MAG: hypothetical protein KGQ93_00570 [Cyanobacteria bacterium REEB459]|nr:hypothetical protein [Cyanobacteria bacterium REEB459]